MGDDAIRRVGEWRWRDGGTEGLREEEMSGEWAKGRRRDGETRRRRDGVIG